MKFKKGSMPHCLVSANGFTRNLLTFFNAGVSTSTGEMVLAFEALLPEMVKIAGSKVTK